MAINLIHDKDRPDEKSVTFPWIGVSTEGTVVLFRRAKAGTVLAGGESCHPVAYYSESWVMSAFSPLPEGEKVVLFNTWERMSNAEV